MAYDFDEVDDRISWGNVFDPVGGAFTISLWVNPDDVDADGEYIFNIDTSGGTRTFTLLKLNSGPGQLQFQMIGSTPLFRLSNNGSWSIGWQNIIVGGDGSNTAANYHIYVDNSEVGYATTQNGVSLVAADGDWMLAGRSSDNAVNYGGGIAEPAVWNVELDAAERKALAAGYSPKLIRPASLKFSPSIIREISDPISGQAGSLASVPAVISHPRIIQQRSHRFIFIPSAGATFNEAITLAIQQSIAISNNIIFNGNITLPIIPGITLSNISTMNEEISLEIILNLSKTALITFNPVTTYNISLSLTDSIQIDFNSSITLGNILDLLPTNIMTMGESLTFGITLDITNIGGAIFDDDLSLGIILDKTSSVAFTISGSISLATSLDLSLTSNIDFNPSISFTVNFDQTIAASLTISEAISLAIQFSLTMTEALVNVIKEEEELDGIISLTISLTGNIDD